ncbi:PREDICTED: BET1 homolog [Branchiostoma belcheri]|uniref:BET1 homolog n=1 Tax=Branchiostoma belcheri TaxID=7741 RepID=A0A6P4Z220_BRABE|nr:PREDICTED: BET1 homolog [Branchiostoma belcheri]
MRRAAAGEGYGQATHQMYEDENEQLVDGLKDKVSALKSLSIDIGNEVREQNKMLNLMDSDFDSSGGLLGATMGRLQRMARAGHNKIWLYMFFFVLFVFFVTYMILKFQR